MRRRAVKIALFCAISVIFLCVGCTSNSGNPGGGTPNKGSNGPKTLAKIEVLPSPEDGETISVSDLPVGDFLLTSIKYSYFGSNDKNGTYVHYFTENGM